MLRAISAGFVAVLVLNAGTALAKERCFALLDAGEEAAWFTLDSQWDHPTDDFTGTWVSADYESGTIEGNYYLHHNGDATITYHTWAESGDHSGHAYGERADLLAIDCE